MSNFLYTESDVNNQHRDITVKTLNATNASFSDSILIQSSEHKNLGVQVLNDSPTGVSYIALDNNAGTLLLENDNNGGSNLIASGNILIQSGLGSISLSSGSTSISGTLTCGPLHCNPITATGTNNNFSSMTMQTDLTMPCTTSMISSTSVTSTSSVAGTANTSGWRGWVLFTGPDTAVGSDLVLVLNNSNLGPNRLLKMTLMRQNNMNPGACFVTRDVSISSGFADILVTNVGTASSSASVTLLYWFEIEKQTP